MTQESFSRKEELPSRQIHLEPNERALRPNWGQAPGLWDFLRSSKIPFRTDPVLQSIIVDEKFQGRLEGEFEFEDRTEQEREFLSQTAGVRVIGWERFAGILIYDLETDGISLYESSGRAKFFPNEMYFTYGFEGLGRPTPDGKTDFASLKEAIEYLRPEIRRQEQEWLAKKVRS